MSAEFTAQTARELLENRDQINKEKWYAKTKDEIFKYISLAALNGDNVIVFNSNIWDGKDAYRLYLQENLNRLGYEFYYNSNELTVKW